MVVQTRSTTRLITCFEDHAQRTRSAYPKEFAACEAANAAMRVRRDAVIGKRAWKDLTREEKADAVSVDALAPKHQEAVRRWTELLNRHGCKKTHMPRARMEGERR